MIHIRLLLFFVFAAFAHFGFGQTKEEPCNAVEATATVTNPTSQNEDATGSVKMTLKKGDSASVMYFFCDEAGTVLNVGDYKKAEFSGLKRGNYVCIVGTKDCAKKVSFRIE